MGKIYYQIQFLKKQNKEYEIQTITNDWEEVKRIQKELLSCTNIDAVKILMVEELDKVIKNENKYA